MVHLQTAAMLLVGGYFHSDLQEFSVYLRILYGCGLAMASPDSATVEEKYRDALSNRDNVNLLVRELAHLEISSLLVKTGALSKLEEGELRATIREDHDRFRRVVEMLLEKVLLGDGGEACNVYHVSPAGQSQVLRGVQSSGVLHE